MPDAPLRSAYLQYKNKTYWDITPIWEEYNERIITWVVKTNLFTRTKILLYDGRHFMLMHNKLFIYIWNFALKVRIEFSHCLQSSYIKMLLRIARIQLFWGASSAIQFCSTRGHANTTSTFSHGDTCLIFCVAHIWRKNISVMFWFFKNCQIFFWSGNHNTF